MQGEHDHGGHQPLRGPAALPHQRAGRRLLPLEGLRRLRRPRVPRRLQQAERRHLPDPGEGQGPSRHPGPCHARHRGPTREGRAQERAPADRHRVGQHAARDLHGFHARRLQPERVRVRRCAPGRRPDRRGSPGGVHHPSCPRRRGAVRRVPRFVLRLPAAVRGPDHRHHAPQRSHLREPVPGHAVDRDRLSHGAQHERAALQADQGELSGGRRRQRDVQPRHRRDHLDQVPLRRIRQGCRYAAPVNAARHALLQDRDSRR